MMLLSVGNKSVVCGQCPGDWQAPGPWFDIYIRPSYLHNGISYTGKMTYLYWIRALTSDYIYTVWMYTHETLVCITLLLYANIYT